MKMLFVILLLSSVAFAQSPNGYLTVATMPQGAEVYLDSVLIGTTPLVRYAVSASSYELSVVYPNARAWNALRKSDRIEIAAEKESVVDIDLGSLVVVHSRPALASVLHRERELGVTPLYYRSEQLLSGELLIRKEGYEPKSLPLRKETLQYELVDLKPLHRDAERIPEVYTAGFRDPASNHVLTYAAGGSMVATGVLAAYWKDRANRDYERYLQNPNPALRQSIRRLDRQSAVALTLSHISFAILTYLLLSD